ncbi:hypothetical protein ACE6ED_18035 [Paenibacillus sp. CN-4]|uniref:hypothetical protein n=1 Tax=Paenibacillus nanchangensis TaxID=3348343 RepID=UPI00397D6FCE
MRVKLPAEALNGPDLSWLCIKPMLTAVRGRDVAAKADMYRQLNEGQQALFLFYAYHNHVDSPEALYWFTAYYMDELQGWNGILQSVRLFGDDDLAELLTEVERTVRDGAGQRQPGVPASPTDLERSPGLADEMGRLYEQYRALSAGIVVRMNRRVMEHAEDFF